MKTLARTKSLFALATLALVMGMFSVSVSIQTAHAAGSCPVGVTSCGQWVSYDPYEYSNCNFGQNEDGDTIYGPCMIYPNPSSGWVSNPECSDQQDNDGDGQVDANDASCHSDGNASNGGSYLPSRDVEASVATGTCYCEIYQYTSPPGGLCAAPPIYNLVHLNMTQSACETRNFYGCSDTSGLGGSPGQGWGYQGCTWPEQTCSANVGNSCYSGTNSCGQYSTGNLQCNDSCSVSSAPSDPAGYGNSCTATSAANACGQTATNTGSIQCNGSCSASAPAAPANPAGYGNSCASAANACGQTSSGSIQCNGSCSATTPPISGCPAPTVSCSVSPTSVAIGGNVTWTATPSGGTGTGYTYAWSGSVSGTGSSKVTSYPTSGNKTASVQVTDSASHTSAVTACTNSLTVNAAAVNGSCSAAHYSCTAGSSISNANNATTWTWTCSGSGGGTDASCSENKPIPTVSCSVSPTSANINQTVTWTGVGAGGSGTYSTYTWSGSVSGTGSSKATSYASSGTYTASVQVTDSNNTSSAVTACSNSATVAAVVNGACSATHYSCSIGGSTLPASNATNWTWTCTGSGGGTDASCTENKFADLQPAVTNTVIPTTTKVGSSTPFSMQIRNTGDKTTGVSAFNNRLRKANDSAGTGSTNVGTAMAGPLAAGAQTSGFSILYTPIATDIPAKYFSICADETTGGDGAVAELSDANNCGAWTSVSITNTVPTVSAGGDQNILLPTSSATPSGQSASDLDGSIVSYSWARVSGSGGGTGAATPTISGGTTLNPTFSNMSSVGTYIFRLTVTDNGGLTASDDMTVTVSAANVPPVANAGADVSVAQFISGFIIQSVIPSGQSASDPDGSIVSYSWARVSGSGGGTGLGTFTTSGGGTLNPTFTSFTQNGTYVMRLTVTDNSGASTSDDMVVTVSTPFPSIDAASISSLTVIPNGSTQYTISVTGSSVYGGAAIMDAYGYINHTGGALQRGDLHFSTLGVTGPSISCGGGGVANVDNFGQYLTLNSCSSTISANSRTVNFVVTFKPLFTTPTSGNAIGGKVIDVGFRASAAIDFPPTFSLLMPDLQPAGTGAVTPTTATVGTATPFGMVIQNTGSATTGTNFNNRLRKANDSAGTGSINVGTAMAGPLAAGAQTSSFTISYVPSAADIGDKYFSICADETTGGDGAVTESNESNNCSSVWTKVTISAAGQCSDGIDNNTSGSIDCADALCHIDGNAGNAASCVLSRVETQPDYRVPAVPVVSGTAIAGNPITFSSTIQNQGLAAATTTSGLRFQVDFKAAGTAWSAFFTNKDSAANAVALQAAGVTSGAISSPTWTATSTGIYKVRACADLPGNTVFESNEGNNCGPELTLNIAAAGQCSDGLDNNSANGIDCADALCHTDGNAGNALTCDPTRSETPPTPTGTFTVNGGATAEVNPGQSATLSWNFSNADSCTGIGFTAGGASGNTPTGPLSVGTYNYQITCTNTAGGVSPVQQVSVTVRASSADVTASPSRLPSGGTSVVNASASYVTQCSVSDNHGWTSGTTTSDVVTKDWVIAPISRVITLRTIFGLFCETVGGSPLYVSDVVIVNVGTNVITD